MTVALAPVLITALSSSTFLSGESRAMSGGGVMAQLDLLWATSVSLDFKSSVVVVANLGSTQLG